MDEGTRERIVELWNAGMNGPQIAQALGMSSSHVYRGLKAAGVRPDQANRAHERPGNRHNSPQDERDIVRRYQDGESLTALGKAFGCHLQTIANVLRRHGVDPRGRGGPRRQFSRQEAETVVRRWESGESQTAIAESLGMRQYQVRRLLAAHGLKIEPRQARGEKHGLWKGGRSKNRQGYVLVKVDWDSPFASMRNSSGYVQEHRLIMARHLGRPLRSWESVHHIDGDKSHNDITNLQLRIGKHGQGIALCCADCGSPNIIERDLA